MSTRFFERPDGIFIDHASVVEMTYDLSVSDSVETESKIIEFFNGTNERAKTFNQE